MKSYDFLFRLSFLAVVAAFVLLYISPDSMSRALLPVKTCFHRIHQATKSNTRYLRPQQRTMATASHVHLDPAIAGVYHAPSIQSSSAKAASELLQKNHDDYHMYFNSDGFHNHIAHHLLTIFSLGASPEELQKAFDFNADYQRPQFPIKQKNVQSMSDKSSFAKFLGKEQYFRDYEIFFQQEIEAKGWQAVLKEHVLAGDDHAEAMMTRMFAGFLHPIIHLGFGVEFKQPAIIAEALAEAATHNNWMAPYFLKSEKLAKINGVSESTLFDLAKVIQENEKMRNAPHFGDANKIRDGLLARAKDEYISLASKWTVQPDQLEEKTAEMINFSAFMTGAAQKPPHMIKMDFFYMHCINASIFFSAFLKEEWLSKEEKARLLEFKGRIDIAMYASRGVPKFDAEEITRYRPKKPSGWDKLMQRIDRYEDDGHASKFVRALANGEQACKPFDGKRDWQMRGDMWLQMGHMVVDSVEGPGARWVRSCGWEEAWKNIPAREKQHEPGKEGEAKPDDAGKHPEYE